MKLEMMPKRILINNGNLGRQGKTTLAYSIYKTSDMPFKFITNDIENASIDLEKHVKKGDLTYLAPGEKIDVDPNDNLIFDFGGKPDKRLLSVATFVDTIIVPIAFQSASELKLTIMNINALIEANKNIVIVINNTENADAKMIKMALESVFPKLQVYEISHSKFIRRLANNNQTVFEVAQANSADEKSLNKKILPQFKALFNELNVTY